MYVNHTYKIGRDGQVSIQNEQRLKPFRPSELEDGRAPTGPNFTVGPSGYGGPAKLTSTFPGVSPPVQIPRSTSGQLDRMDEPGVAAKLQAIPQEEPTQLRDRNLGSYQPDLKVQHEELPPPVVRRSPPRPRMEGRRSTSRPTRIR